ncbi:MAG: hypothetical protein I8H76_04225 [Burkholderiales bacterium]|nr:hypothetical protein [Burkholderiales bacterium]MBH2014870.1 hypothetical protein [Burkholderiales bacterium]
MQALFEKLLPEGEVRAYLSAQRKASTLFALLQAVAGDTAGAHGVRRRVARADGPRTTAGPGAATGIRSAPDPRGEVDHPKGAGEIPSNVIDRTRRSAPSVSAHDQLASTENTVDEARPCSTPARPG